MDAPDKRLVIVTWQDAACDNSWRTGDTVIDPSICWTAGWLYHESPECIMIVGTIADGGDFNQSMTIPAGMITSMKDVG